VLFCVLDRLPLVAGAGIATVAATPLARWTKVLETVVDRLRSPMLELANTG
jgi:hypothetical protein